MENRSQNSLATDDLTGARSPFLALGESPVSDHFSRRHSPGCDRGTGAICS
ncbi:MAG: hypothetical protein ACP5D7_17710 [Limnospira sp.]